MHWLIIIGLIFYFAYYKPEQERQAGRDYDSGHGDGYTVGYNKICTKRTTLIKGDWENEHYFDGYNDGEMAGESAAKKSRCR